MDLIKKEKRLRDFIRNKGRCLVALSGGIDSSYLSLVAFQELKENMKAVTSLSPSNPKEMVKIVKNFLKKFKIPHIFIETEELKDPLYIKNDGLRCYACKKELFEKILRIAKEEKFNYILEGSQANDIKDIRPGMKAINELGVLSPLLIFNFKKEEIRERAKKLGIPHYDLPESACLSSRILEGEEITKAKLLQVEKGEEFLKKLGFNKLRVRHHGNLARIEFDKIERKKLLDLNLWDKIVYFFKKLGFQFVTIDLEGYKRGGGNLRKNKKELEVNV